MQQNISDFVRCQQSSINPNEKGPKNNKTRSHHVITNVVLFMTPKQFFSLDGSLIIDKINIYIYIHVFKFYMYHSPKTEKNKDYSFSLGVAKYW